MSESQGANEDPDDGSSASPNQSCSTESCSDTSNSNGVSTCCSSSKSAASGDLEVPDSCSSNNFTNGSNWQPACMMHDTGQSSISRVSNETEESTNNILNDGSDEVIQTTQQRTGLTCDTNLRDFGSSCPDTPQAKLVPNELGSRPGSNADTSHLLPSTSHSTNDDSFNDMHRSMRQATLETDPQVSTIKDTNNNSNSAISHPRSELLSGLRKNNFSKSASGSRLLCRSEARKKVCDCLSQNCNEKEHSNRRRFIESYYNSRTRLPTASAMSTSNINTPLNRLSECDEITKRLLSSPIRTVNLVERPSQRTQVGEMGKSRRASLGTNAITEQVSLFASSQFNSIESDHDKNPREAADSQDHCQPKQHSSRLSLDTYNSGLAGKSDGKLRHFQSQQQQQGRSFSVCQDDTSKVQFRNNSSNHSVNLNRAVSLACETSSSRQSLTIIPLFGCDMKALEQHMRLGWSLPPPIESAINHILAHGINAIGIFRKSGVKSRILTLKKRIESNQGASLDEINKNNEFSIYDIADLVKMWFRELKPMPLMTKDLIRVISKSNQTDQIPGPKQQRVLKQQIEAKISPTHKALLSKAITFFASISLNGDINQMTSQNLAICLTPSLCATESDQTSILTAQGALKYCIDNYQILF